jgi:hypothetical protein
MQLIGRNTVDPVWMASRRKPDSQRTGRQKGPKVLWKVPIGEGYSGISVVGGRLYTMDAKGQDEFVVSLDAATGKEAWRVRIDSSFMNDQGNGPRGTPTVHENLVYALGAHGMLVALNASDGKKIWGSDLKKDAQAKVPIWGISSSPFVEGDSLIVPAGGGEGNAILAFIRKPAQNSGNRNRMSPDIPLRSDSRLPVSGRSWYSAEQRCSPSPRPMENCYGNTRENVLVRKCSGADSYSRRQDLYLYQLRQQAQPC